MEERRQTTNKFINRSFRLSADLHLLRSHSVHCGVLQNAPYEGLLTDKKINYVISWLLNKLIKCIITELPNKVNNELTAYVMAWLFDLVTK
jgi:hypothetical protein